jgi:hypothetical protein
MCSIARSHISTTTICTATPAAAPVVIFGLMILWDLR